MHFNQGTQLKDSMYHSSKWTDHSGIHMFIWLTDQFISEKRETLAPEGFIIHPPGGNCKCVYVHNMPCHLLENYQKKTT